MTGSSPSATGPAPAADERIDVDGRCVIPGFVDSHTHLVFAGDRAAEFAARMAGAPYEAGGINVTIDATRAATRRRAATRSPRRASPRPAGPASRRSRSSPATAPPSTTRPGCCASPRSYTPETTFLGAHVVPAEYAERADDYVELVCRRDARRRRPARPLDRRLLRARRVRRRPVPRGADGRPGRRARAAPARQPARAGPGRAARRRARLRVGRPLHVPLRRRRRRAGGERHRGDVPPGDRLLDPPAVPRRPPGDRRRRHRRPGHQLQPGVELHDVDVVRHRPRRARPAG